ncbi:synaptic vesicular amine transporter-like [Danaus plexippus]|uniref:synaptic vesicular amine transporter-like n=1 Tax=Danaus plexippus TaxID=13037 RepID=UPI002AB211B3|nr:synaptic vesicular amine transporter-like [Danaus plexippus]
MLQSGFELASRRMLEHASSGAITFALVYLTFFLDNVLLTVLVPIIPDWVRGESLELWSQHETPLVKLLNNTVRHVTDQGKLVGTSQAIVGAVLGSKAAAQLATAPAAAALVMTRGPTTCLRLATAILTIAALTFGVCAGDAGGGAVCAGLGRATQGAGAALAGVGGLTLVARSLSDAHGALAALLGAVALGVLVGYPFGGAAYKLWSPGAPFQLIAFVLLINLALQFLYLNKDEYTMIPCVCPAPCVCPTPRDASSSGITCMYVEARSGSTGWCAGAVLLTTSVMAALEPCLPLWIMDRFHPQRWALGAVFIPDSAGYLLASVSGAWWVAVGAERVAVSAVACVGLAALALPHAPSVSWLSLPQLLSGLGLGAADAALVPALLARAPPAVLAARAALLQAASSAAYAIGPVVGGLFSWAAGFESAMMVLGAANAVYAVFLYRMLRKYPISAQWGACESPEETDLEGEEMTPLKTQKPPR